MAHSFIMFHSAAMVRSEYVDSIHDNGTLKFQVSIYNNGPHSCQGTRSSVLVRFPREAQSFCWYSRHICFNRGGWFTSANASITRYGALTFSASIIRFGSFLWYVFNQGVWCSLYTLFQSPWFRFIGARGVLLHGCNTGSLGLDYPDTRWRSQCETARPRADGFGRIKAHNGVVSDLGRYVGNCEPAFKLLGEG